MLKTILKLKNNEYVNIKKEIELKLHPSDKTYTKGKITRSKHLFTNRNVPIAFLHNNPHLHHSLGLSHLFPNIENKKFIAYLGDKWDFQIKKDENNKSYLEINIESLDIKTKTPEIITNKEFLIHKNKIITK